MPPHRCRVCYTDLHGVRHCTVVTAESLYEAAVMALQAFRAGPLLEDARIDRLSA